MNSHLRTEGAPRATWTLADLTRFLQLFRRSWLFLMVSAMGGLIATLGVLVMTVPTYMVTAKLMVGLGTEMMAPPILGTKEATQVMPAAKRPEDVATEIEILTNPRLVKRVVDDLGADFFLAELPAMTLGQTIKQAAKAEKRVFDDAVRQLLVLLGLRRETTPLERLTMALEKALRVETIRKSDVIELTLSFPDPKAGEIFLGKFIEFGLESHVVAYKSAGARQFFLAARDARNAELESQRARITALSNELAQLRDSPRSAKRHARSTQQVESELVRTIRDLDRLRRSLDIFDKGLEEARIAETMETMKISNLKLIMPPTAELFPSSPSILRYLLIGVGGSITLAICIVILRDTRGQQSAPNPQSKIPVERG